MSPTGPFIGTQIGYIKRLLQICMPSGDRKRIPKTLLNVVNWSWSSPINYNPLWPWHQSDVTFDAILFFAIADMIYVYNTHSLFLCCALLFLLYHKFFTSSYQLSLGHSRVLYHLTHWGRVTHKCVSKLDHHSHNGLPPARRSAAIWTNAAIFNPEEKLQWNLNKKIIHFHSRKCI